MGSSSGAADAKGSVHCTKLDFGGTRYSHTSDAFVTWEDPMLKTAGSDDGFLIIPRRSDIDANLLVDVEDKINGGVVWKEPWGFFVVNKET